MRVVSKTSRRCFPLFVCTSLNPMFREAPLFTVLTSLQSGFSGMIYQFSLFQTYLSVKHFCSKYTFHGNFENRSAKKSEYGLLCQSVIEVGGVGTLAVVQLYLTGSSHSIFPSLDLSSDFCLDTSFPLKFYAMAVLKDKNSATEMTSDAIVMYGNESCIRFCPLSPPKLKHFLKK